MIPKFLTISHFSVKSILSNMEYSCSAISTVSLNWPTVFQLSFTNISTLKKPISMQNWLTVMASSVQTTIMKSSSIRSSYGLSQLQKLSLLFGVSISSDQSNIVRHIMMIFSKSTLIQSHSKTVFLSKEITASSINYPLTKEMTVFIGSIKLSLSSSFLQFLSGSSLKVGIVSSNVS